MTHPQWFNADGARLDLSVGDGRVILGGSLEFMADAARYGTYATCGRSMSTGEPCREHSLCDHELIRFSYQPTGYDDDEPVPPRRYARIVIQELPAPEAR